MYIYIYIYIYITIVKGAVRNFLWLKMIQNQYLSKCITSQCSELSPYFSRIHNGYLITMFSHLSGTDSSLALRHYVTSVNMKKLSRLVSHVRILQIVSLFSQRLELLHYHFDGGL